MREIKFRVWDEKLGRYIDDDFFINRNTEMKNVYIGCDCIWDDLSCHDMNEKIIIEQYTGLKDKNGVEIYEGDILLYCYSNGDKQKTIVEYCDDMFHCKSTKYKNLSNGNYRLATLCRDNEIIGNIHESPIN